MREGETSSSDEMKFWFSVGTPEVGVGICLDVLLFQIGGRNLVVLVCTDFSATHAQSYGGNVLCSVATNILCSPVGF